MHGGEKARGVGRGPTSEPRCASRGAALMHVGESEGGKNDKVSASCDEEAMSQT